MKHPVLRTYDLAPDGIRLVVEWDGMVVGASIFVPCINTKKAIYQAKRITTEKGWGITGKTRIEGGKLGVRIWRVL